MKISWTHNVSNADLLIRAKFKSKGRRKRSNSWLFFASLPQLNSLLQVRNGLIQFLCKSKAALVCGFVTELGHYELEAMN